MFLHDVLDDDPNKWLSFLYSYMLLQTDDYSSILYWIHIS